MDISVIDCVSSVKSFVFAGKGDAAYCFRTVLLIMLKVQKDESG